MTAVDLHDLNSFHAKFYGDIGHEPPLEPPEQEPLTPCAVCGSEDYNAVYRYKDGTYIGCSDCVEREDL